MKKRLLLILTSFCFSFLAIAQEPSLDCSTSAANVLCGGINNITSMLPPVNTAAQPTGACNIAVHNGAWYSFVAGTASITIEATAGNCIPPATCNGLAVNEAGIQSALFAGCGPNFQLVSCGPQNVQPNSSGNIFLNGLIPGTTYHLMLDGFCNAVCGFTLNTVAGSTVAPPITGALALQSDANFQGPNTGCVGGTYTVEAAGVMGIGTFTWTLPDGSVFQGPSPINVTLTDLGPVQVCAQGDNGCDQTNLACVTINGVTAPPTAVQLDPVCPGTGFATYMGNIFPPNPNNIGMFGTTQIMVQNG